MAYQQQEDTGLRDLKQALKSGRLNRFYIFHGEETFLLHHYLDMMRKQLVDPLTESFNSHKLTKDDFDMLVLADAVESLPMMAENTFVWVDDIDIFKLPDADRTHFAEIIADIPDYCTGCHFNLCNDRGVSQAGAAGSDRMDHPSFCCGE